ncbi:MAG: hypothetical protein A3H97_10000 [Acidobacteria bacterium RIFCSPLOWO2_02_FULL_65_29]|nr:MAG: hypothetical protein A3H97_10000 [Acidobacteria bacterium RIFCSPLOWO2_02_FULL_65_29]
MTNWFRWFDEVGMDDLPAVGGKNASFGEMRRALTPLGIRTPDGFATTADAYRAFLRAADLERVIEDGLRHLDVDRIDRLQAAGGRVRSALDSLSLNPDSQLKTMLAIVDVEKALAQTTSETARDVAQVPHAHGTGMAREAVASRTTQ